MAITGCCSGVGGSDALGVSSAITIAATAAAAPLMAGHFSQRRRCRPVVSAITRCSQPFAGAMRSARRCSAARSMSLFSFEFIYDSG